MQGAGRVILPRLMGGIGSLCVSRCAWAVLLEPQHAYARLDAMREHTRCNRYARLEARAPDGPTCPRIAALLSR